MATTDNNRVPQDQKKRSLEALERRFASAKAELALHQKKQTAITSSQEDGKHSNSTDSSGKGFPFFPYSNFFPIGKKNHFCVELMG